MKIIRTKKHLLLKLEKEKNYYDIIISKDLFWNDIYFYCSAIDGWQYFYDANIDQIISIDDYKYNIINDLLNNGYCYAQYKQNIDYDEYEWNQN